MTTIPAAIVERELMVKQTESQRVAEALEAECRPHTGLCLLQCELSTRPGKEASATSAWPSSTAKRDYTHEASIMACKGDALWDIANS